MNQLLMEYDDILIGKRDNFSGRFFGKDNAKSMENAIAIIRYAFEYYLRWPPEAIEKNLNKSLMEKFHLMPLMKYIEYPIEYDKDKDYFYLVTLAYHRHKLDFRAKTIHTYENIINGVLTKYPKDYFAGSDGIVRAGICLQYLINHYIMFTSINELYYIFSCEQGYDYLKKYKLLNACRETFDTPVDFVHFILTKEQKNEFYFHYYKFKYLREMVNENGRKKRPESNYMLEVVV